MMKAIFFTILVTIFSGFVSFSQTQKDTIYAYRSNSPVVVDASDSDSIWGPAKWYSINQVWIPFNASMKAGDFEGRYKVAWDADFLYLLVEIKDDSLSDDHANPMQNWWDDDCVELFIDENRSKGKHECNFNAFAYHVGILYDAIDMNTDCSGINLKNNIKVVMDTLGDDTYLWEFAVKMYNEKFNPANTEASRVKLTPNKLAGFSIAYCDNDEGTARDNFIGSVAQTSATANESYKNADYLGTLLLVDPNYTGTSVGSIKNELKKVSIYPAVAEDFITISQNGVFSNNLKLEIHSISGALLKSISLNSPEQTLAINDLAKGSYIFRMTSGSYIQTELVVKK